MVGQPTKCTPDTTKRVCASLRKGHTIKSACEGAGITQESYYTWLKRASDGPPYADFSEAVTRAQHEAKDYLLSKISAAEDWRAQAWIMERRWRDEFGKDGGQEKKREPLEIRLVDAQYDEKKRAEEE